MSTAPPELDKSHEKLILNYIGFVRAHTRDCLHQTGEDIALGSYSANIAVPFLPIHITGIQFRIADMTEDTKIALLVDDGFPTNASLMHETQIYAEDEPDPRYVIAYDDRSGFRIFDDTLDLHEGTPIWDDEVQRIIDDLAQAEAAGLVAPGPHCISQT